MTNRYKAETPLEIAGKTYRLVFDYEALARVKADVGEGHLLAAIQLALKGAEPRIISLMLAAGLARHHPEMTFEAVWKASPPIMPAIDALNLALAYALFGPKGEPEEQTKPNPPKRMARLLTRLSALFAWRTAPASGHPSSGG